MATDPSTFISHYCHVSLVMLRFDSVSENVIWYNYSSQIVHATFDKFIVKTNKLFYRAFFLLEIQLNMAQPTLEISQYLKVS